MKNSTTQLVITALAAFAIGSYGTYLVMRQAPAPEAEVKDVTSMEQQASTTPDVTATGVTNLPNLTLDVPSQAAGNRIVVETVKVDQPTWLVITEDDAGRPARILGAKLVQPGEMTLQVELLRGTTAGNRYHAIFYKDNGDKRFDYKEDEPIRTDKDELAEVVFAAQ